MTQVQFASFENPVASAKLNTAIQGYRFLRRRQWTATSSVVIATPHPRAAALYTLLIGPGGGGGGAAGGTASDAAGGAGGSAGGFSEGFITDTSIIGRPLTILAPAGGTGGVPGGNGQSALQISIGGGGDGQSSSALIAYRDQSGTLIVIARAAAGLGGLAMPAGTVFKATVGAASGGSIDFGFSQIIMEGEPGRCGFRFGPNQALAGGGGGSRFRGYCGESGSGPGENASSYGTGGGGGASSGTVGQPGGNGGDALVIIEEYA